jgi:hypothetical protein
LEAVKAVDSRDNIKEPFQDALDRLAKECDAENSCLFEVLQKVDIILGPGLGDFEAVLSSDHIAKIDLCSSLVPAQINALRDELIQKVSDASSNRVDDPSKHWCCVNAEPLLDPRIQAKQLLATLVIEIIRVSVKTSSLLMRAVCKLHPCAFRKEGTAHVDAGVIPFIGRIRRGVQDG